MTIRVDDERGVALLIALLTTLLVSALAAAVVLTTSSEVLIGSAFRWAQQAMYSADAAAEWTVADISPPGVDWPSISAGTVRSAFVDGVASGVRALEDGTSVDLGAVSAANPGWHAYAYGRLDDLLPVANRGSHFYVIVLTAADGASADRVKVRALAFGPRGAHSIVEITAVRGVAGVRVDSWLETR
jgi:hypothetical protein